MGYVVSGYVAARAEFEQDGRTFVAVLVDGYRSGPAAGNVEIYVARDGLEIFLGYAHLIAQGLGWPEGTSVEAVKRMMARRRKGGAA